MRSLFTLFLSLLVSAAMAQTQPLRPTLAPWESIGVNGHLLFTADGHYLLLGAGRQVLIYDLKKRVMLTSVTGVTDQLLAVAGDGPYFYTWGGSGDSMGIQKRALPLGGIMATIPLPKDFANSYEVKLLLEPGAESGSFLASMDAGSSAGVLLFDATGTRGRVKGLPRGEYVNAMAQRDGRIWALTSHGLWRQRDSLFEKVELPGEADYGNAAFNGDTLVIVGRSAITWYDTRNGRVARQTAIPGFFVSDINDASGSRLRLHHPFAIDRSGKVWINDSRRDYNRKDLHYPPYTLALVGDRIEYPFHSTERETRPWKYMEAQVAYDPKHDLLAAAGGLEEIELLDRHAGRLFTIARKDLQLEGIRFTATAGRILVRFAGQQGEPAFLLHLGNGRMESISTLSERYMVPGSRVYTGAQPTAASERIYRPSTGQWTVQPYLRYNKEVSLLYNDQENKTLYLPRGRRVTVSEEGLLEYRDSTGKPLRSLQLTALEHDLYGPVDAQKLTLNKATAIAFKGQRVDRAQYDSASGLLYLHLMDNYSSGRGTQTVIDLEKMKVLYQNTGTGMALLPGGKEFINDAGIFDLRSLKTVSLFESPLSQPDNFLFSRDGARVFALVWRGHRQPAVYDIARKTWTDLSPFEADELMMDPHSDRLFALSRDKGIAIWDTKNGTPVGQIVFSGNRSSPNLESLDPSYLVLLPDGYYMGQNKYYQLLQLQQNGRAIGLAEMDGLFHRPDKVLRALGYATPAAVNFLEKIAQRRSSRFNGTFPATDAAIEGIETLPFYQAAERLSLQVRIPEGGDYKGLMAYANGTALQTAPLPLQGKKLLPLDVALVDATTHLRVCLVDAAGKETPGDFLYVQGKAAAERDLYVIGIGVSDYRDARYNLKYAAKDMSDLTNYLKSTSSYKKVHLATWQNGQVTPATADSVRAALRGARPQDVVLCYFAGHGLLDPANNYFLATHDQDFSNPARGGLPVEVLSAAVAASNARKKLIVIDACHSGLVDDLITPADAAAADTTGQASVVKRGITVPGADARKASELYFSFQQFGPGSGVDILAASAGNEYALELGQLQNGVFTYSLMQALKTGAADIDNDKHISLGELQRYVAASTTRLTRGAQRPTFRQANLYQDMALFAAGDTYLERLMAAARTDNGSEISTMLASGSVNVQMTDPSGFTALHYASREGSFAAAKLLLDGGADLNARTPAGFTPLYLAAYNNNYRVAYLLMTRGATTNNLQDWQLQELQKNMDSTMAPLLGNFPMVKQAQERLYALAAALAAGKTASADSLMQIHKLRINQLLILEGMPVLFAAVFSDQVAAAQWAIEHGANVNARSVPDQYTPLMTAAVRGHEPMIRLLLEKGARKTAQDRYGRTAADFAREAGKMSVLPLLTE